MVVYDYIRGVFLTLCFPCHLLRVAVVVGAWYILDKLLVGMLNNFTYHNVPGDQWNYVLNCHSENNFNLGCLHYCFLFILQICLPYSVCLSLFPLLLVTIVG